MLQHSKPQTKKTLAKTISTSAQANEAVAEKPTFRQKRATHPVTTPEQRQKMIDEAAYYLAKSRDFIGGNPMEDWLVAEAEIDNQLSQKAR